MTNTPTEMPIWQRKLAEGLNDIGDRADPRFSVLMRSGSMSVEVYAPRGADPQTPHLQDELYIIQSGHGTFFKDGARVAFEPGDVLFVEAGLEHRFEDFSDDFVTWVIFWGPEGGETKGKRG